MLHSEGVRYLLVGGHAVICHGYVRSTGDMDIWIACDEDNAAKVAKVLHEFGWTAQLAPLGIFREPNRVFRMGNPPVRIELLTDIDGVKFEECYAQRERISIEGVPVDMISLAMLKQNKRASGRYKDLADLDYLP